MTGPPPTAPAPLLLAAALVALQGVGLVLLGALELAHLDADRVALAVTTSLFFLVLAGGLLVCARGLARVGSWARSPVVAIELIAVLTAYSIRGGATTAYAVGLGVVSVLALVGVLHPASTRALAASPD